MKHSIITLIIISILSACKQSPSEKTIYMVRHAEKDLTDSTHNPPLTAEGVARAAKLTEMLAGEDITAIYTTGLERTINTVKGSADLRKLDIRYYDYHKPEEMLEAIRNDTGAKVVLIGGHSDNLFPMMDYFNARRPIDSLGHHEYDKLFKMTLKADTAWVEMIIY